MARLARETWLELGLAAAREGGAPALRLEALLRRAGRTRGSFYHHFESHGAFLAEMTGLWRARTTVALTTAQEASPDTRETAGAFVRLGATLDLRLEAAIRRIAVNDQDMRRELAAVDEARIEFLRQFQADPDNEAAADYALIGYAAVIGLATVRPDIAPEDTERLGALIVDMIAAHWNE